MNVLVIVLQAERPIITIKGSDNLARTEHDLLRGEKIFRDITINSQTRKEQEETDEIDKIDKKVGALLLIWIDCMMKLSVSV